MGRERILTEVHKLDGEIVRVVVEVVTDDKIISTWGKTYNDIIGEMAWHRNEGNISQESFEKIWNDTVKIFN